MKEFIVGVHATIRDALIKIEQNKKGFIVVLDVDDRIIGTVTDGDIRRQLINGSVLTDVIKYSNGFAKLHVEDSFKNICEYFKSEKISFLPIVDSSNKLVNILTKKQFHSLLLHDQNWDLKNSFANIDEREIDHEIYDKPWGFYKSTILSDYVQSKIITLFSGESLSLQEHKRREEHWVIIKGKGKVVLGESIVDVYPGKYIYIPKGCKHQIINDSNENIIFSEVQLGDYFGEDDIIRYKDKYGRR